MLQMPNLYQKTVKFWKSAYQGQKFGQNLNCTDFRFALMSPFKTPKNYSTLTKNMLFPL